MRIHTLPEGIHEAIRNSGEYTQVRLCILFIASPNGGVEFADLCELVNAQLPINTEPKKIAYHCVMLQRKGLLKVLA